MTIAAPTLATRRLLVAKADDAPAPTIIISGSDLDADVTRPEVAVWMADHRTVAMAADPRLGAKTIVVLPSRDRDVRVEFFQGRPDGAVDVTAETCLNSAACAVAAVRADRAPRPWTTLAMAGATYRFEVAA